MLSRLVQGGAGINCAAEAALPRAAQPVRGQQRPAGERAHLRLGGRQVDGGPAALAGAAPRPGTRPARRPPPPSGRATARVARHWPCAAGSGCQAARAGHVDSARLRRTQRLAEGAGMVPPFWTVPPLACAALMAGAATMAGQDRAGWEPTLRLPPATVAGRGAGRGAAARQRGGATERARHAGRHGCAAPAPRAPVPARPGVSRCSALPGLPGLLQGLLPLQTSRHQ